MLIVARALIALTIVLLLGTAWVALRLTTLVGRKRWMALSAATVIVGVATARILAPFRGRPEETTIHGVWNAAILAAMACLLLSTFLAIRTLLRALTRERESLAAILGTMDALVAVLDLDGTIVRFNGGCERLTGYRAQEVEGKKTWESFIPERERQAASEIFTRLPAGGTQSVSQPAYLTDFLLRPRRRPPLRRFSRRRRLRRAYSTPRQRLGRNATLTDVSAVSPRKSVRYSGQGHLMDRSGREHLIDWRASVVTGEAGKVHFVIVTGIDVTDQRRMDRARDSLYRVSVAAREVKAPEDLLPLIHRALGEVMDASNFYVAFYDAEKDLLRFPYFVDEQEPETPPPMPIGKTLTGYVLRTGKPLLADPKRFQELIEEGEVELVGADSIDWLGAPLRVGSEILGVMAVQSYRDAVRYSRRDLKLLVFMANQLASLLEQTRAAQALREREARYRQLFDRAPVGIFHYDRDLVFTACNEAMARMLGSRPERIVGLAAHKLKEKNVLPAMLAPLQGRDGEYEGWYRPTTGDRTIWGILRTTPVPDAGGNITGGIGIVEDTTRRKQVEEAIQKRDAILGAVSHVGKLFLKSEDPANVLDIALEVLVRAIGVNGAHLFENRRAADGTLVSRRKYGWTDAQHEAGAGPRILRADLRLGRIGFARWEELFGAGQPVYGSVSTAPRSERRLFKSLGIRSVAAFPILVNARWWGFVVFEDRERERDWSAAEIDALQLAASTLAAALLHKTMERRLFGAQKMEAIGQLAGGIAHDFNNLLMAIHGAVERLQDRVREDGDTAHDLRLVKETADRAATMTRRLLAFARRQVIEPTPLDLNQVVERLLPTLRRMIPEHIVLDLIPASNLGMVMADATQMEQILINLCVNARDAMPEGGTITLETENVVVNGEFIATHPWAKEGRYVLLSVTDTGTGMDPVTCRRAFEPFFTTKEVDKGTGMGLATVYGIVKQHDGMVHLYSEVGKGTTVKIYLPLSTRRAAEVGTKIEAPVRGGKETILVVEDDPAVRDVMHGLLTDLGYEVQAAEDGRDALALLHSCDGQFDLVISDIMMPRMGGQELFAEARAVWPGIRFLFTTGYSENVVHEEFIKKEGISFLTKPFGRDTLARRIRQILESPAQEP